MLDSDELDREILAKRLPFNDYMTEDIAEHFGIHRQTVVRALKAGRLPEPRVEDRMTHAYHWTPLQVIEMEQSDKLEAWQRTKRGPIFPHVVPWCHNCGIPAHRRPEGSNA